MIQQIQTLITDKYRGYDYTPYHFHLRIPPQRNLRKLTLLGAFWLS